MANNGSATGKLGLHIFELHLGARAPAGRPSGWIAPATQLDASIGAGTAGASAFLRRPGERQGNPACLGYIHAFGVHQFDFCFT